jgi:hypothetical protein
MCAQGQLSFPDLDAQLQQLWDNIVRAANVDNIGVQPNTLQVRWDVVWKRLVAGMSDTAYDRYVDWYRGKKRRLEGDEDTGELVRTNAVHGSAMATRRSTREAVRK